MKKTLLFALSLGTGLMSFGQCVIDVPTTVCLTNAPVGLNINGSCGEFSGPGVTGNSFDPVEAGLGTHTVTFESSPDSYCIEDGIAYNPIDISDGTTTTLGDDALSAYLPMGFTFTFFGNDYTDVRIGSNGFLTFGGSGSSGCCSGQNLPNGSTPNDVVAFSWEDLDPGNGGAPAVNLIRYKITGTAPNRVFVVEFFNVDHYPSGDGVYCHTELFETTNCIEIHLGSQPATSGNHTLGIENAAGTEGYAAPGKNASPWTAENYAIRFCPNAVCSATVDITVVEGPVVTATVDVEEICLGESIILDGSGTADSYSYGPGIELGEPYFPGTPGLNVFIIAGTDEASGCIATAEVSVLVHDIPNVEAGDDFTVCADNEFTLEAVGDEADFAWDNGAVDGEPMVQEPGSVTYTVTATNEGGCEATSSVTVESLAVPTGTGVVTMMTGVAYDGEIDFTPSGGTGGPYTFLWSNGATTEDIAALGVGSYTVTVSDGNCDSDVTFFVDSQAGIELNKLDNLKVYPNPATNEFTIELKGKYQWDLYDNTGRLITQGIGTGKEVISISALAKGSYYVKVNVDGKISTIPLVKE